MMMVKLPSGKVLKSRGNDRAVMLRATPTGCRWQVRRPAVFLIGQIHFRYTTYNHLELTFTFWWNATVKKLNPLIEFYLLSSFFLFLNNSRVIRFFIAFLPSIKTNSSLNGPLDEWWYNRFVSSVFLTTKTCELIHCCYTNLLICVWPPHFRSITQLNRHINYCWLGDFCESCRWWMLKLPDRFNGSVRELWHANMVLLEEKEPCFEKRYSKYGNLFGLSVIRRNGFEWNYLLGNAEAAWRDHITKRRILWHNRQSIWRWSPCLECAAWVVLHSLIVCDLARRAWCLIDIDCCCLKRFDRLCHQLQTGGSDLENCERNRYFLHPKSIKT